MSWAPPDYVDLDEVAEVAREMGFLSEKAGPEYLRHLREETDVNVMGVPERVADYLDPYSESAWVLGEGRFFFPAMDLRTDAPFDGPMGPEPWQDHIAVLVGQLDLVLPDLEDHYEGTGSLDFVDIIRLEVYNQILGFKNAPQLRSHLLRSMGREGIPVHQILGFDDVPHQNTIRNARQRRFGPKASEFVKRWASRIELIGIRRGYEFPEVDDESLVNNGGVIDVPVELKRGYSQGALDLGRDHYPVEKDGFPIWDDYGLHFDFSLHLCDTGGAPEAELENFADNRGLQMGIDIFQTAETFRNDVYRVHIDDWVDTINQWTDNLLDAVYPRKLRSRGVPLAIDSTNIPVWSNEQSDLPGVLGTKKMPNTHYAYRIFTAQAVSDGMPFQIAHTLQMTSENRAQRLMDLLDEVEARDFEIGMLMADSEFAPGEVVTRIKERGLDFIIQIPNHWVQKYIDGFEEENQTFGVVDEYTMNEGKGYPKETTNTMFASYETLWGEPPETLDAADDPDQDDDDEPEVDPNQRTFGEFQVESEYATGRQDYETARVIGGIARDELEEEDEEADEDDEIVDYSQKNAGWLTYITSFDVNVAEAKTLREYYKYRWSIESSYGTYKENFLPKTKSTNLGMRTYLYLYAMFAYNAWIAANAKCRRQHLDGNERNRPPIRARRFTTLGQQRYRREEFPVDYINFRE